MTGVQGATDFVDGIATLVVSRDMGLVAYRDEGFLREMLSHDVDRIAAFRGSAIPGEGGEYWCAPVVERRLVVAVPPLGITDKQVRAINHVVDYASSCGVVFSIMVGG